MPQMKVGKGYYTAAQVKEKLGITQGQLYNYVRNGTLHPVVPPGKRNGVYTRREVDQLADELQIFMDIRQKHPTTFEKVTTREEVFETTKISDYIFGGHIDTDRQIEWLKRNPDISYVVKSEGKVVGYVIILPLQPEKIKKILREEESTIDIEPSEIEVFEPGVPLHLYGGAIGTIAGLTLAEKRTYGTRLIRGLIDVIIDMGKRGIVFETFTARSTKPDGIRLLRNLGFAQIPSIAEKKDFVLDIKKSGAREAIQYKQALISSGVLNSALVEQYALPYTKPDSELERENRQDEHNTKSPVRPKKRTASIVSSTAKMEATETKRAAQE